MRSWVTEMVLVYSLCIYIYIGIQIYRTFRHLGKWCFLGVCHNGCKAM